MFKVRGECDRCGNAFGGMKSEQGIATTGYYNVTAPPWDKYARDGERFICDACMQSDPQYISDYDFNKSEVKPS